MTRKRRGERGTEKGKEGGKKKKKISGEEGGMQTKLLHQNRHKVLSARQEARSAPLKRDLFKTEHNCQIAIIASFLNECGR